MNTVRQFLQLFEHHFLRFLKFRNFQNYFKNHSTISEISLQVTGSGTTVKNVHDYKDFTIHYNLQ